MAADEIVQLAFDGIEEHAVDGEIAAQGVFAGRGEHDLIGASAVAIAAIGAKGRHLDAQMFAVLPRAEHLDDAEACADGERLAEKPLHLFGQCVGGNVVILRRQP